MAHTYVEISRQDIEDWLNTLPRFRGNWWLAEGKAGIYMLPLSERVAIKFSSTVGRQDQGLSRGGASAQFRLVSLVTNRVLNKKAQGQKGFHRTTNWRVNWKKGVDTFIATYTKSADFYERIALPKHQQENPPSGTPPTAPQDPDAPASEDLLAGMRLLYRAAQRAGDQWLIQFLTSIGPKVKAGQAMSQKQIDALRRNLNKYDIPRPGSIDRVASRWLVKRVSSEEPLLQVGDGVLDRETEEKGDKKGTEEEAGPDKSSSDAKLSETGDLDKKTSAIRVAAQWTRRMTRRAMPS